MKPTPNKHPDATSYFTRTHELCESLLVKSEDQRARVRVYGDQRRIVFFTSDAQTMSRLDERLNELQQLGVTFEHQPWDRTGNPRSARRVKRIQFPPL
jgi:hypothetical protein